MSVAIPEAAPPCRAEAVPGGEQRAGWKHVCVHRLTLALLDSNFIFARKNTIPLPYRRESIFSVNTPLVESLLQGHFFG